MDEKQFKEFMEVMQKSLIQTVEQPAQVQAQPAVIAPPAAMGFTQLTSSQGLDIVTKSEFVEFQKSQGESNAKLDALLKVLMPAAEGQEAGPIIKAITMIEENVALHGQAMEQLISRVENVEGSSAVRKNLDGDDFSQPVGMHSGSVSQEAVTKAAGATKPGSWDGAVRNMLANPGRKGALTLK